MGEYGTSATVTNSDNSTTPISTTTLTLTNSTSDRDDFEDSSETENVFLIGPIVGFFSGVAVLLVAVFIANCVVKLRKRARRDLVMTVENPHFEMDIYQ